MQVPIYTPQIGNVLYRKVKNRLKSRPTFDVSREIQQLLESYGYWNLSLNKAVKKTGISRSTYDRIKCGKYHNFKKSTLLKACILLHLSFNDALYFLKLYGIYFDIYNDTDALYLFIIEVVSLESYASNEQYLEAANNLLMQYNLPPL